MDPGTQVSSSDVTGLPDIVKEPKVRKRKKEVFKKIRTQMEFYFSDSNLQKDEFLLNLINQSEGGYVELSIFMRFNKIRTLASGIEEIVKALSSSEVCQLSDNKLNVRRIMPFQPIPNVDERTIYVENIPSHSDHDWFHDVFKSFGKVVYVSLPRFATTEQLKGFAFVEFDSVEAAESACRYYSIPSHADLSSHAENMKAADEDDSDRQGVKRKMEESQEESLEAAPSKIKKHSNGEKKLTNEEEPLVTAEQGCTKKHRKRKKKHKEKSEAETLHLRVMSKIVWSRFKEKYLSLQKANMGEVKKSLKLIQQNEKESIKMKTEIEPENKKCPPGDPEFIPGVIIRLTMSQHIADVKGMKKKLKEIACVKYVDIKECQPCIYIRCTDAASTGDVLSNISSEGTAIVLQGEEEQNYWKQITADRAATLNSQAKTKIRGSQKIMAKVIQVIEKGNTHIRFDE